MTHSSSTYSDEPFAQVRGSFSRARSLGKALHRLEDGQAVVELALVLPLLLLILFGIAQFGLALNAASDETHLANEVARYAVVNEDPSKEALAAWGKSQADSSALSGQTVCITFPTNGVTGTSKQIGDPVEVVVKGTMSWLPIIKLKAASTVVEGKARMRLETAPTSYGKECA
jgi:Flp pilus assembly protein TadG